jgi:hypothetical protein
MCPSGNLRTWDSGRRAVPALVLQRARSAVAQHTRLNEVLLLDQLARELHVHLRTLQAAVRTGRLDAHFSVRSAFGRPIRSATRAAGDRFMATHYRRFAGPAGVSVALAGGPERLRSAAADSSSSVRTHARRLGPAHWRGRKGCHLPMGIAEESAVTRPLATRPAAGPRRCARSR